MEDSQEQSQEQKQALEGSLARGSAFEVLIRSKGWEYIQAWYQNKIQHLATALLLEGDKDIKEFENERRELIGLRKLIGMIESDIRVLEENNEKAKRSAKK